MSDTTPNELAVILDRMMPRIQSLLFSHPDDPWTNIPFGQVRVIRHLQAEALTHSELSQRMHLTPGAVSQLIDRMAKTDLVEEVVDSYDRRIKRVSLSPKCQEILNERIRNRCLKASSILAHLSEQERGQLLSSLESVQRVAKELGTKSYHE